MATIGTFHLPAGISTEDYEGLLELIAKSGSYDAASKSLIIKNGTGEDAATLFEIPLDVTGQFSGDAASVGCTVTVDADGKIKVVVDQTLIDDVAANKAAVAKNAEDIAKNAEDIGKNGEAIAKNAEDIAKNAEDIAKNAEDISANAEAIAANAEEIAKVDGKISTAIGGMAHDITYEDLTITIPMKAADGTEGTPLVINLPKDNFLRSGSYDAETQELVLVVDDDLSAEGQKEIRIPASELVDVYTADNTGLGGVEVTVSDDNKISAKLVIDAASILSVNAEGKLTIDTTGIYQAIADAKSDLEGQIATAKSDLEGQIATAKGDLEGQIATAKSDVEGQLAAAKGELEEAIGDVDEKVDALDEKVDGLYTPADGETAASGTIAVELSRIEGAHNTLAQTVADNKAEFDSHTHDYTELTGTPTKLSDFTNDLDVATTGAVAAKQDKVVVYETTVSRVKWVAGEDGATYALDLSAVGVDWAKGNIVDIAPKTAADGDVCLNAKVSSVVADAGNGTVTLTAESVPSADVAVVVTITPDVTVVGA